MTIVGYTTISGLEQKAGVDPRELFGTFAFGRLVTDVVEHAGLPQPNLEVLQLNLREADTLVIPNMGRLYGNVPQTLERVHDFYCRRIRLVSLSEGFDTGSGESSTTTLRVLISLRNGMSMTAENPADRMGKRKHKFGRSPALSEVDIEAVLRMALQGATTKELMASFGCSRRTILRAMNGTHTSTM